ncbi:MAG: DUF421 domain-containing protein [Oscillospiraceae bacterium]
MLISLFRTIILYILVICTMRILGKRQIGQLQPAEFVITLLLSEILVIPMQDTQLPLINTFIPAFLLVGFEILISVISLKSIKFRSILQGNSLIVISNGVLDQKQLKRLRFTIDDLLEALRKKDVFDISIVQYAIVETDGTLSVMLKPEFDTPDAKDFNHIKLENKGLACVIISDGEIITTDFKECGLTKYKFNKIIEKYNIDIKNTMLMTIDKYGNKTIIKKEV